jgi:hypothetical protein
MATVWNQGVHHDPFNPFSKFWCLKAQGCHFGIVIERWHTVHKVCCPQERGQGDKRWQAVDICWLFWHWLNCLTGSLSNWRQQSMQAIWSRNYTRKGKRPFFHSSHKTSSVGALAELQEWDTGVETLRSSKHFRLSVLCPPSSWIIVMWKNELGL